MSHKPVISAVFVASGQRLPYVQRLVQSLQNYDAQFLEVIAVDNASQPSVAAWLQQSFPRAMVASNAGNLGTARAYNAGIRLAGGAYLLVLNDDCCLCAGVLEEAVAFLEAHVGYDGLGLSLLNPDGTRQFTKLYLWSLRRARLEREQAITFVGTNNLLCRRETFDCVGLFDEHLFFYNEDLEWSWRAHEKGARFYYRPDFGIMHGYGFAGKPTASVERQLARDIANAYVYRKHFSLALPVIKTLARRSLKRGLRRTGNQKLYPQLRHLLDLEREEVVRETWDVQRALLTGSPITTLV